MKLILQKELRGVKWIDGGLGLTFEGICGKLTPFCDAHNVLT